MVDLASQVNVIIEEAFCINKLHMKKYVESKLVIYTHDGFFVHPIGSISLSFLVGPKSLDVPFIVILESSLFRVRLGIS